MDERLKGQAQRLLINHPDAIRSTCRALAFDFNTPAQRSINAFFERIGTPRFTRDGDDLWEAILALRDGTEYARPERRLIDRWARA